MIRDKNNATLWNGWQRIKRRFFSLRKDCTRYLAVCLGECKQTNIMAKKGNPFFFFVSDIFLDFECDLSDFLGCMKLKKQGQEIRFVKISCPHAIGCQNYIRILCGTILAVGK